MKSMMTAVLLIGLVACGSKGESGPGKDWSGKPLDVTIKDKVKGVEFSIQAPAGMKLERDEGPDAITKSWEADLDDPFSEPGFSVAYASIPPEDLDGFVDNAMVDEKDVIAKKETLDDGFKLVYHTKNKGIVRVHVLKRKGEHSLVCRASQAKDGGVPSPDKTIAWLEQLCGSLTIL